MRDSVIYFQLLPSRLVAVLLAFGHLGRLFSFHFHVQLLASPPTSWQSNACAATFGLGCTAFDRWRRRLATSALFGDRQQWICVTAGSDVFVGRLCEMCCGDNGGSGNVVDGIPRASAVSYCAFSSNGSLGLRVDAARKGDAVSGGQSLMAADMSVWSVMSRLRCRNLDI